MEQNNVKRKTKRNVIIILCGLVVLTILLVILNIVMDKLNEIPVSEILNTNKPAVTNYNYKFYTPDYEYNILDDTDYLDKNRYIEYTNGAVSITIADGKFSEYGKPLEFFNEYFTAVINGDHNTYNSFFSDEYYEDETHIPYEKFTMQRVYNINVELIQQSLIESGVNYGDTMYIFKVSYMIMKNDGTFRNDMGSDGAVPMLFEIIYDYSDGICFINNMARYNYLLME